MVLTFYFYDKTVPAKLKEKHCRKISRLKFFTEKYFSPLTFSHSSGNQSSGQIIIQYPQTLKVTFTKEGGATEIWNPLQRRHLTNKGENPILCITFQTRRPNRPF